MHICHLFGHRGIGPVLGHGRGRFKGVTPGSCVTTRGVGGRVRGHFTIVGDIVRVMGVGIRGAATHFSGRDWIFRGVWWGVGFFRDLVLTGSGRGVGGGLTFWGWGQLANFGTGGCGYVGCFIGFLSGLSVQTGCVCVEVDVFGWEGTTWATGAMVRG